MLPLSAARRHVAAGAMISKSAKSMTATGEPLTSMLPVRAGAYLQRDHEIRTDNLQVIGPECPEIRVTSFAFATSGPSLNG
jgi:hypothetical protein